MIRGGYNQYSDYSMSQLVNMYLQVGEALRDARRDRLGPNITNRLQQTYEELIQEIERREERSPVVPTEPQVALLETTGPLTIEVPELVVADFESTTPPRRTSPISRTPRRRRARAVMSRRRRGGPQTRRRRRPPQF